ncbi:MAG TPA: acetolactate synthase large subunit, partial [Blastocatellia bacterium]|nr:acetolactate synthase large subunit [Blastocatellia bacterium]
MNGAESVLRTAVAAGIEVCFANPGTTEMPLVLALDNAPGIRAVLGLFEGVCTGAADGYGRMAEKPALTLLHLGPGFANGIAYLHDARRARSPIVNLIGDMATWHLAADAPLTSDIHSLAKPVSAWVRSTRSSEEAAGDIATAIAAASALPGRIATLILPHDAQLESASGPATPQEIPLPPAVGDDAIRASASMLSKDPPAALFLGGHALRARGLRAVERIAAATGCKLICETFPARIERGAGMPAIERLPYFPEQGIALLSRFQSIVLAGALPPVSFFGYPGIPSYLISPVQTSTVLASPEDDVPAALEALADSLDSKGKGAEATSVSRPAIPTGAITLETLAAAVTSVQPEGAIVMDEGNTSSAFYFQMSHSAPA